MINDLYKCSVQNIYIHIPFCFKKCFFCAFPVYAIGKNHSEFQPYVNHLIKEIRNTPSSFHQLESIYIGGGTPSLLPASDLKILLNQFPHKTAETEITLELNPSQLNKINQFQGVGFNRFSLGIQTFNNKIISTFNRQSNHNILIRQRFKHLSSINLNVDFILDFNQQSDEHQMLNFIQEYQPKHISLYILQVNQGSYLFKHKKQFNQYTANFANYNKISYFLASLGYIHYEVSNFSKPGFQSKHNKSYWEGDRPFISYGLGSSSLTNCFRVTRPKILSQYYEYVENLCHGILSEELLQIQSQKQEKQHLKSLILSKLRTKDGLDMAFLKKYIDKEKIMKIRDQFSQLPYQIIDSQNFKAGILKMKIPEGFLYVDEVAYRIILLLQG